MSNLSNRQIEKQIRIDPFDNGAKRKKTVRHGISGGRYQDQPGLTLPKVD